MLLCAAEVRITDVERAVGPQNCYSNRRAVRSRLDRSVNQVFVLAHGPGARTEAACSRSCVDSDGMDIYAQASDLNKNMCNQTTSAPSTSLFDGLRLVKLQISSTSNQRGKDHNCWWLANVVAPMLRGSFLTKWMKVKYYMVILVRSSRGTCAKRYQEPRLKYFYS